MALYSVDVRKPLDELMGLEWLLTNGLGSFCSSNVVGCNTRRYHGLLCAATTPPVGRIMTLNRLGEAIYIDGNRDHRLEFSVNQFRDRVFPHGEQYLRRVEIGDTALFEYDIEGVKITKEIAIQWQRNTVTIAYTIAPPASRRVELNLAPMVSMRDFHALRRQNGADFKVAAESAAVNITTTNGDKSVSLRVESDQGVFSHKEDWWFDHVYPVETERGQDDEEDLFCPGTFVFETDKPANVTITASVATPAIHHGVNPPARAACTGPQFPNNDSPVIQKLIRAASDFLVYRRTPTGEDGTTVLAGYPWFADWGRDTMIALPGLLLATGRFDEALQVLSVFASYVSEGMIPNVFDDYTNEPKYNTVDASLWFIHAAHEYARLSNDSETFKKLLLPACQAIVEGYKRGTRYNIHMDPGDGLITQGDANTQLTWMDARCDGISFTPRQGKPVEINALWHNALVLLGETELAHKVADSFKKVFWISPFRGLCDVVHDNQRDTAIRPNQIFAVSLPNSPLTREQQHAVVEVVRRELLTPYGLRTLAKSDPKFHPKYTGPQRQRDEAYHNGTVWPWLIGAFLDAHLHVHDHSAEAIQQARQWLFPLLTHVEHQTCIGQISEVFDGDPPHRPGGCCAQAWSVAEVLRLALKLEM
jgi:predicted glycogen debranching enzyme